MQTYLVNRKKARRAAKNSYRAHAKTDNSFTKICYILTVILRTIAVILSLLLIAAVIAKVVSVNYLAFLGLTICVPYGFSYMTAIVYIIRWNDDYAFRMNESLTVLDDGFIYSYHDQRSSLSSELFSYDVRYDSIEKAEFDEALMTLTLFGNIPETTIICGQPQKTQIWPNLSFQNIFDMDISKVIFNHIQKK